MDHDEIYVVVGEKEEMIQRYIGYDFEATYHKELVRAFTKRKAAEDYVKWAELKEPKCNGVYSGKEYYRGGYYSLDIENVRLEENF